MKYLLAAAIGAAVLCGSAAHAVTFKLGDHPNGAASATKDYGLRIDDLAKFNGDTDGDFFSFEENGAEAFMTYDMTAQTAVISGTMWRNSDPTTELWTVDYTVDPTTATVDPEFNGFNTAGANGTGVISNGSETYYLRGKVRSNDLTFIFSTDDPKNQLNGVAGLFLGKGGLRSALSQPTAIAPMTARQAGPVRAPMTSCLPRRLFRYPPLAG